VNPRRWSLRLRVAVAFLATSASALIGLGVFVVIGMRNALEERLVDAVEAEAAQLAELSPDERLRAVVRPPGELVAQIMAADGHVAATSRAVVGRLLPAGRAEEDGIVERAIRIRDDDEVERVGAILRVRRLGDQTLVVAEPRDDIDETLVAVRGTLLVGGLAALAAAGALGYIVAGAGLRPIERMRERAATISDRSAGERLPLPVADDELRRLAETLNAMLDRLDDGLERQRRFVAEASHELRTPLALMRTEIELALARPRSEDELRDALRSADEETQRLIALADRLLLLAAADAGRLALDKASVDLAALARSVVHRFQPRARELGRELNVISEPGMVAINGDAGRLDQAVSNLVENALRHGEGTVTVELRRRGADVELAVGDEGPGIADARPFERFSGSSSGAGLGLAIVQEIVRAHGGNVAVEAGDRSRVVLTLRA
jgi:signal transduction histidine kinase